MQHTEDRELASASIKAINNFIAEFEAAYTTPNVVFLSQKHYNAICTVFPYMIDALTFKYNKHTLRIVITKDTAIGLAFTFFTDYVYDYQRG